MSARHNPRTQEPARGKYLPEQRTKNCAAGSCDPEACLTARPDRNVGSGVEEVVLIAERVNVGNTDDRRYGGTMLCQSLAKEMTFNSTRQSLMLLRWPAGTHLVDLHGSH
jgi:hypothetical protein